MRDEGRRVKHSEEKLMYSTGDYRVTGMCLCVCVCRLDMLSRCGGRCTSAVRGHEEPSMCTQTGSEKRQQVLVQRLTVQMSVFFTVPCSYSAHLLDNIFLIQTYVSSFK